MSNTPADGDAITIVDLRSMSENTGKRARSGSPSPTEEGGSTAGPSKRNRKDLIPEDAEFDSTHNDPSAGVILVTNNVAKRIYFRVHRHALMKACGMFSDLLSLSALCSEPIDFPARRFILAAFLTLVYQYPNPVPPIHLKSHDLLSLLDLAEKYDSPNMITAILKAFDEAKMTQPWRLFVLGSQRDDLELARRALRGLRVEDKGRLAECERGNWELYRNVDKPYLCELLRLLRRHTLPVESKGQVEKVITLPSGLPAKPPPQADPNNVARRKKKGRKDPPTLDVAQVKQAPGRGREHWHGRKDLEPGVEFGIDWKCVAEQFVLNSQAGKEFATAAARVLPAV